MSVTPADLMQLAVELCRSPHPVRRRVALSRAYYALFHAAIDMLSHFGIRVARGPSAHGAVRAKLLNAKDDELVHAGSQLGDSHRMRIAADYDLGLDSIEEPKVVLVAVEDAQAALDSLSACHHEPRRSQVFKALKG